MITEVQMEISKIDPLILYGLQDFNINLLAKLFDVQLIGRGNILIIKGEEVSVSKCKEAVRELIFMIKRNGSVSEDDIVKISYIIRDESNNMQPAKANKGKELIETSDEIILTTHRGVISLRSKGQRRLIDAIKRHDVVFAIGPAGTGKTYLSVAMAIAALKNKEVLKIILARPAVEAGESLGFLPGDLREKIDPYLRPLYDALNDMLPKELLKKYFEQDIIEVTPLAYMRGRTLNNSFVILDEAQNTTSLQMKMILTRLGINSKIVINGDVTQIDLPNSGNSGLSEIKNILRNIKGIHFVNLGKEDVVRHRLVKDIIHAYDQYNKKENGK